MNYGIAPSDANYHHSPIYADFAASATATPNPGSHGSTSSTASSAYDIGELKPIKLEMDGGFNKVVHKLEHMPFKCEIEPVGPVIGQQQQQQQPHWGLYHPPPGYPPPPPYSATGRQPQTMPADSTSFLYSGNSGGYQRRGSDDSSLTGSSNVFDEAMFFGSGGVLSPAAVAEIYAAGGAPPPAAVSGANAPSPNGSSCFYHASK
jgi:hypothetical protein